MNLGIGPGKTREDHRGVANRLYASYAYGRDLRRLVAIVGEEALTDLDKKYLKFADMFEGSSSRRAMKTGRLRPRSRSRGISSLPCPRTN